MLQRYPSAPAIAVENTSGTTTATTGTSSRTRGTPQRYRRGSSPRSRAARLADGRNPTAAPAAPRAAPAARPSRVRRGDAARTRREVRERRRAQLDAADVDALGGAERRPVGIDLPRLVRLRIPDDHRLVREHARTFARIGDELQRARVGDRPHGTERSVEVQRQRRSVGDPVFVPPVVSFTLEHALGQDRGQRRSIAERRDPRPELDDPVGCLRQHERGGRCRGVREHRQRRHARLGAGDDLPVGGPDEVAPHRLGQHHVARVTDRGGERRVGLRIPRLREQQVESDHARAARRETGDELRVQPSRPGVRTLGQAQRLGRGRIHAYNYDIVRRRRRSAQGVKGPQSGTALEFSARRLPQPDRQHGGRQRRRPPNVRSPPPRRPVRAAHDSPTPRRDCA